MPYGNPKGYGPRKTYSAKPARGKRSTPAKVGKGRRMKRGNHYGNY